MNVEFFVKQIAMNKDKEGYVKKRIKTLYIPYEEKVATCENIINATSYIEIYKRNTPSRAVFFSLTLIDKYTDIDIDFKNVLKDYNILDENNLIELIIKSLPAKEVSSWRTLLEMIDDDLMVNERSLISFLSDKSEAAQIMIDSFLEITK